MYRKISTICTAVLWVLLPKCSLCLVAYAGIFSALGLGSLLRNQWLLPVVISLIVVNLAAVLYMSVIKKEYSYAILCLLVAILLAVNKLYIGISAINLIAGIILLVAMLRIRLFRLASKSCVFDNGKSRQGHCA